MVSAPPTDDWADPFLTRAETEGGDRQFDRSDTGTGTGPVLFRSVDGSTVDEADGVNENGNHEPKNGTPWCARPTDTTVVWHACSDGT